MNIVFVVILSIVGAIVYAVMNMFIRRLVAGIRSREDYDEDVDGKMTKEEKKAFEERKVIEADKVKISLKDTYAEYNVRFIITAVIGFVLSALTGIFIGLKIEAIIAFVFFAILTMIFFIDLDTMEIPPVLNFIILGLGIIDIFIRPEIGIVERLIGFACVSGVMLLLTLIIAGAFGGGDIKLMAAAGLLLGWKGIVNSFLIGIFVGAAVGIIILLRKKKGKKEHIPFGPSLVVGLVYTELFGPTIIDWYIQVIKNAMPNTFGS